MTLRARLNRLALHRSIKATRPEVTCIFLRRVFALNHETREVTGADTHCASVWTPGGWETVIRNDGESEAAFVERIEGVNQEVLSAEASAGSPSGRPLT